MVEMQPPVLVDDRLTVDEAANRDKQQREP